MPLADNAGRPIDAQVILELHRKLLSEFQGFTVHPTSQGRWQSRAGRFYEEEVVVYEVAIPEETIPMLREIIVYLGRRLGQLAMYFDAPAPSVEILETPQPATKSKGSSYEPRQGKATRGRGKRNRPPS
jgi:hypothetical protein